MTRISFIRSSLLAITASALLLTWPSFIPANDSIDAAAATRAGLTTLWQSQIQMDTYRDEVVDIHLHIHDDRSISYYELTYQGVRETIAFDDLSGRGVPYGDKGALEWAELRKEVLEAEGKKDVQLNLIVIPKTTIYVMTQNGSLQAIDGESGQIRWQTRVGKIGQPSIGIASNNNRVVAVRGSRVYCLDALTGDAIWNRPTEDAPGGGVSMSPEFAFVTSVSGGLQVFPMNATGLPDMFINSGGAASYDPVISPRSVAWATETGYFNVAHSKSAVMRFRLQTGGEFHSAGAAVGDYLIANSVDGNVFALFDQQGSMAWEYSIGERLDRTPVAVGRNTLLLTTANDNLVGLNLQSGQLIEGWPKNIGNIDSYVGASQNILYFVNTFGQLVGLRRDSASQVASVNVGTDIVSIPNSTTDRLYLMDKKTGALYCMRELANRNPFIIGDDFEVGNSANEAMTLDKRPEETAADGSNPFESGSGDAGDSGKGDDPFKSGGGKSDDPFKSGGGDDNKSDDPFNSGGSDDKKSDDPFNSG